MLPTAAPIAFYEGDAEADSLIAYAGVPIGDQSLPAASDAEVVVLSAIEAATVVRRGDATEPQAYYALLARHIEDHGYRLDGHGRDILIAIPDDRTEQVVEMQLPMKRPTN